MTDVLVPANTVTTRDLGSLCARQTPGARVLLPLGARYKYNGTFAVPAGVTVMSQSLANSTFAGHAVIHRDESYALRIAPDLRQTVNGQPNAAYNPRARSSQWQYDAQGGYASEPAALTNPHAVKRPDGTFSSGATWGGFDATTQIDAAGHLQLLALYGAPWTGLAPGDVIEYLVVSGTGGTHQALVTQVTVAADGRSIDFGPAAGLPHVDSSGTVAWCVHKAGAGWAIVNPTDPTVPAIYVGPSYPGGWDAYQTALQKLNDANNTPAVSVKAGGQLIGVEVSGANARRDGAITNYEKSDPLVNEFQHNISIDAGGTAVLCDTHHAWGDGFNGPGAEVWGTSHDNGRQGTVGSYANKVIVGRYYANRHSDIDIEAPSGGPCDNVSIDVKLGGTGIAWSTPLTNSTIKVSSTNADVAAGLIPALSPVIHAHWGGGGSHVDVQVNADYFNAHPPHNVDPALTITGAVDVLHVHDSHKQTDGYFLKTDATNLTYENLDGGAGCLGPVAP